MNTNAKDIKLMLKLITTIDTVLDLQNFELKINNLFKKDRHKLYTRFEESVVVDAFSNQYKKLGN